LVHTRAEARSGAGVSEAAARRRVEDLLADLDHDRYPAVVGARTSLARLASEQAFDAGIEALIAGLRCQVRNRSRRPGRS
jgi:hypothetical protein